MKQLIILPNWSWFHCTPVHGNCRKKLLWLTKPIETEHWAGLSTIEFNICLRKDNYEKSSSCFECRVVGQVGQGRVRQDKVGHPVPLCPGTGWGRVGQGREVQHGAGWGRDGIAMISRSLRGKHTKGSHHLNWAICFTEQLNLKFV